MTHAYGYRSGTRSKFSKKYRQHGMPKLSKLLTTYKRGDYVTIMADSAVQKGMPHQFYHGRTGVVYDVCPRAVGVKIAKRVRNREILKSFHVRIEHVKKSRCREQFLNRCRENARLQKEHKEKGGKDKLCLKRQPAQPGGGLFVKNAKVTELSPIPFAEFF